VHSPNSAPSPPPLYLTHPHSAKPHTSLAFCPFQDILSIGHNSGISCILVPGSGEPNFDSSEADPFEGSKARREREVKSLLDKVPFPAPLLTPHGVKSSEVVLIAVLDPTRHDRTRSRISR